jgi:hypothetical protein
MTTIPLDARIGFFRRNDLLVLSHDFLAGGLRFAGIAEHRSGLGNETRKALDIGADFERIDPELRPA